MTPGQPPLLPASGRPTHLRVILLDSVDRLPRRAKALDSLNTRHAVEAGRVRAGVARREGGDETDSSAAERKTLEVDLGLLGAVSVGSRGVAPGAGGTQDTRRRAHGWPREAEGLAVHGCSVDGDVEEEKRCKVEIKEQ